MVPFSIIFVGEFCVTIYMHILRVGLAVLVRDTTLDLDAYSDIGFKIVADSLCGNGLAVVAYDTGLNTEVAPSTRDDFREAD